MIHGEGIKPIDASTVVTFSAKKPKYLNTHRMAKFTLMLVMK